MFEAVAAFPAWVSQTQRLLKQVGAAALSQPLCVPDAALYGTLASPGFGPPNVLSRFRLRQVRGLLLALNSRNTLARETTRSLWSVPSVRALCLFDWSSLDATLAEYSLSFMCAAALGDATVWCERCCALRCHDQGLVWVRHGWCVIMGDSVVWQGTGLVASGCAGCASGVYPLLRGGQHRGHLW